jgi:hypothetical protein
MNLGRDTGYPESLRSFTQFPRANTGRVPRSGHYSVFPNLFRFIIHQPTYHPTLYSLNAENAVK